MDMATTELTGLDQYMGLASEALHARIDEAKRVLGDEVLVLGHHYQRDEVFGHADITGDSLKLSREAANSTARYIVFCGVHFMAEVADILTRDEQVVILPDLAAGCSMADMADGPRVERAWQQLQEVMDPDQQVTPITYINSSAELKAFCGRHGGLVCTSSNARSVLEWALERRDKVLFFPDQHLGRNTGLELGFNLDQMPVFDPDQPRGGVTGGQLANAKMLLWNGYCSVHQMFAPEQVQQFRAKYPEAKVIAHPEASYEVCQLADYVGSTEVIIRTVSEAEAGSRWLVATELNLVNRLREQMIPQQKSVHFMGHTVAMCSTMFRTDPPHLLWVLEQLVAGTPINRIEVPADLSEQARTALDRMLAL